MNRWRGPVGALLTRKEKDAREDNVSADPRETDSTTPPTPVDWEMWVDVVSFVK